MIPSLTKNVHFIMQEIQKVLPQLQDTLKMIKYFKILDEKHIWEICCLYNWNKY